MIAAHYTLALSLAFAILSFPARADYVELTNGNVVEGVIQSDKGDTVIIKTMTNDLVIPKSQILNVVRQNPEANLLIQARELEKTGRLLEAFDIYSQQHAAKGSNPEIAQKIEEIRKHVSDEKMRQFKEPLAAERYDEVVAKLKAEVKEDDASLPSTQLIFEIIAEILQRKGNALLDHYNYKEALKAFQDGLVYHPYNPDLHRSVGKIYLKYGRFDDALRELEDSYKIDPTSLDTRLAIVDAYLQKEDFANAVTKARLVQDEEITSPDRRLEYRNKIAAAYKRLVVQYEGSGQRNEAIAAYKGAVEYSPQTKGTYQEASEYFKRMGALVEAVEMDRKLGQITSTPEKP